MRQPPAILFTDLDGTLLDLETYDPGPAAAALHRVLDAGVSVYFCSSKTFVEQQAIAASLDVAVGMIVENGAAVHDTDGHTNEFGTDYETVRTGLRRAARDAGVEFCGYADMTEQEVMRHTGLDREAALRACRRGYSESFLIEAGEPESLATSLESQGLRLVRGARFWTVQGQHDKGVAVRFVVDRIAAASYGLGDHDNDLEMLLAVDRPMIVQRPDGTWRNLPVPNMTRLSGIGPAGWRQGAEVILGDVSR